MKRKNKRDKERIQGTNREMRGRKEKVEEGDWRNDEKIEKLKRKVSEKKIKKTKRRGSGGVKNLLKEVKRMLERKEKKEKRKNIVIKGVKVKKK